MAKAIKESGRPKGTPNKKNVFMRNHEFKFKCSEGFYHTIHNLKRAYPAKSQAQIMHEALQVYAIRHLEEKTDIFWINKIL